MKNTPVGAMPTQFKTSPNRNRCSAFRRGGPLIVTLSCCSLLVTASAQTFTNLHSLTGSDGASPYAGLVLSGNTLYGTASTGGSSGNGTVFAVNTDGTGFTNLHSFAAGNYDPSFNFTNSDGVSPLDEVILSGNTLYGTARSGGSVGAGTLFRINTDGTGFTNLHNFTGGTFPFVEGRNPSGLILSGNTLYGTTATGGSAGNGTVFAVNTDGSGFTNLHTFTTSTGHPTYINGDGMNPQAGLILSSNTLYGMAYQGGSSGKGTVFAVNTDGTGFTNLHNFLTGSDGAFPRARLVLSGNTLYGTTSSGNGPSFGGTVFAINTDGTGFTNLHGFTGNDGNSLLAGLIISGDTLYGTASLGGSAGYNQAGGTVFAVNTDGTGFTNLFSFGVPQFDFVGAYTNSEGAFPSSALVYSANTLYGTAQKGGNAGNGTVFRISLPVPPNQQPIVANPIPDTNSIYGSAFDFTFAANTFSDPDAGQNLSYVAGNLPPGISFDGPSRTFSGPPTNAGTYSVTVTATDNGTPPLNTNDVFDIVVAKASLIVTANNKSKFSGQPNPPLDGALAGVTNNDNVTATFTTTADTGSPAGIYPITPVFTDPDMRLPNYAVTTNVGTLTVEDCPVITVNPSALPDGSVGAAYSQTNIASGGGAPYSFAVTSGTLPGGLTLSSAGLLSGAPINGGSFSFAVTATDAGGCTGSRGHTIIVRVPVYEGFAYPDGQLDGQNGGTGFSNAWAGPSSFVVQPGSFPNGGPTSGGHLQPAEGTISRRLSEPIGTLGTTQYLSIQIPLVAFGSFPRPDRFGVLLNGTTGTGLFVGRPNNGTFNWTLENAAGGSAVAGPTMGFFGNRLVVKCEFLAGNDRFTLYVDPVPGQPEPASGTVKFNSDAGTITNISFTVVNNGFGLAKFDELRVASTYADAVPGCPAVTVNPATLSNGQVGQVYAQTNSASGAQSPYTFTVTGGTLPPGIFLSNLPPASCVLSGTPSASGSYSFNIRATDAIGCSGVKSYTVKICSLLTFNPASLQSGYTNIPYNQTVTATNGQSPYSFSVVSGALPPGLSLASSGTISGTPTGVGDYSFTVLATDANGCTDSHAYDVAIFAQCPTITLSPAMTNLPTGISYVQYSNMFTATGGLPPYTFSWNFGASFPFSLYGLQPSGLLLDTPYRYDSYVGMTNYTFTVTVTDAAGCTGVKQYSLRIAQAGSFLPPADQLNLSIPPTGTGGSGNPANDRRLSTLQVSGIVDATRINQISVGISLDHASDGDLVLTLISPLGERVLLSNQRGGSGSNYADTVFYNDAPQSIVNGAPPFTGQFRPEQGLGFAGGTNLNGTWTLEIQDLTTGNIGVLRDWWLNLTSNPLTYTLGTVYSRNLAGSYIATDSQLLRSRHQTYLVNSQSSLIAASTLNGGSIWTQSIANAVMGRPVPVDRSFSRFPIVLVPLSNLGTGVKEIRGLNPTNGATVWTRQLATCSFGGGVVTTPESQLWNASDATFRAGQPNDDLVFVSPGNNNNCLNSETNKIYALRALNGTIAWTFNSNGGHRVGGAELALDLTRNTLFCSTDTKGSVTTNIWAVNTVDGSLRWGRNFGIDGNHQPFKPLLANGAVYVTVSSNNVGSLVKLNPDTGATIWNYTFSFGAARAPMAFDSIRGRILVVLNGAMVSIQDNGASATQAWQFSPLGQLFGVKPVVVPELETVYIYSGSSDNRLYSIDLVNGFYNGYVFFPGVTDVIGDSDTGGASTTALMIAPLERYQLPFQGTFGTHTGSSLTNDLALSGTLQPAGSAVGTAVTCTLTVTNRGNNTVSPLYVGDVLPAGLSFVSASVSRGTYSLTANKFSVDFGRLMTNGTATISLVFTSSTVGLLEHRAATGGYVVDSVSTNNSVLFSLLVNAPPILANLISDTNGTYGSLFTYTFPLNTFSDPDAGQVLSYTAGGLPPGITFTGATRTFSGTPTNAGPYAITVTATDNGVPALNTNDTFNIVVDKAPLTVSANNTNRPYGEADPTFTGTLVGVTNSDNLTVTFTTTATLSSPPGPYPITPTLQDPNSRLGNYIVTTNLGALTINGVAVAFGSAAGSLTFCWPSTAAAFLLEYTDDLTPPVTWQSVTSGITTNAPNICLTVAPEAATPSRFYRLRLP